MGEGKKRVLSFLLLLLVPVFCGTVAWADVRDPCDSTEGPGSYRNLAPPEWDYISWDRPPDPDYLCQQSNRQQAAAVYRCPGAREVQVAIYSRYGSYAGWEGEELVRGGDQLPLEYQASTGEVYCDGRRMAYDAELGEFVFLEEESPPSGLRGYGLSVYASEDGSDYTEVPCQLISARREGPDAYWYEVYQAEPEEGTRYLRLTLTDQSSIQILGREERYRFETTGGLSLASVEIIGEEEPPPEEETPPEESTPPEDNRFPWEDDPAEDEASEDDRNGWEEEPAEESEPSGTGGLPAYRPGEEEGDGELLWGPAWDDGGPAFPDEYEEENGEDSMEAEAPSSRSSSSSASGSSNKKSSSQSGRKKGNPSQAEPEESSAAGEQQRLRGGPPPAREEAAFRRDLWDPEVLTMLVISFTLLSVGVRILWSQEDGEDDRRSPKKRRRRSWRDNW